MFGDRGVSFYLFVCVDFVFVSVGGIGVIVFVCIRGFFFLRMLEI